MTEPLELEDALLDLRLLAKLDHKKASEVFEIISSTLSQVGQELVEVSCLDCAGRTDDEFYTCTTCWNEGGDGSLKMTKKEAYRLGLFEDVT